MITIPFLLLATGAASAITVPLGWTEQGTSRVVLDPAAPERGEIREYVVTGGSCDPDELGLMLMASGLEATAMQSDDRGYVDLAFGPTVGRGTCRGESGGARWVVVLASAELAPNLDPDALLAAALPPGDLSWGEDAVAVLAPGTDGNPWGAEATADAEGWWGDDAVEGWAIEADVVGTWEGTAFVTGTPTRLKFRFESNGQVVLERKMRGTTEVFEGAWATRNDRLRMEVPGGGENLPYRLFGTTLNLEYAGASTTLHRRSK